MKRIFTLVLIASTFTIFTSSCKKDLQVSSVPTDNASKAAMSPFTLTLKANEWINEGDGFFVNSFKNIIPPRYYNHAIKVYLLSENREIQINHFISFMEGELWASVNGTDVTVIYHCFGQRRFDYLDIKVLIV